MSKRKVYEVQPKSDGSWNVKARGGERASGNFDNKTDAIDRAKELAKAAPEGGQVIIKKADGTIQTEHTYGEDPYPPKG
jgi:hypothetical protein